eukprot:GAHX01003885.1.p2 GENE.GAHX01003885.1~~GAHX01003885.1.p2  ORF type:complete len:62 (-),score=9.29 GAHX01003885.1:76-261(-)
MVQTFLYLKQTNKLITTKKTPPIPVWFKFTVLRIKGYFRFFCYSSNQLNKIANALVYTLKE